MKIKSLLLGSAAALVAVSGARAADAVVIPEPEAVEYVRVCDAAGAGYYYIPGSETCLKFSGYVRYQISQDQDSDSWQKDMEARILVNSWTDSEYGPVTANIRFDGDLTNGQGATTDLEFNRMYLTIGGLNMGLDTNLYDFDQDGAADALVANGADRQQISYTADFGSGSAHIQLIEDDSEFGNYVPNIIGRVMFSVGDLGLNAAVAYDDYAASTGDSSWGAKLAATYMGFGAHVAYTSDTATAFGGGGDYSAQYTWVLGANYSFDATDKLNINAAVSYGIDHAESGLNDNDFVVGLEASYALTDTFSISSRVRYIEDTTITPVEALEVDGWDWRMRFTSTF